MPPRLISHYRVIRRLGAGGMGEVFLAQDTQLERPVALKVMSAELAKDPNQRKRFRTEAKAASGLSHPHICVIHEVGETGAGRPLDRRGAPRHVIGARRREGARGRRPGGRARSDRRAAGTLRGDRPHGLVRARSARVNRFRDAGVVSRHCALADSFVVQAGLRLR